MALKIILLLLLLRICAPGSVIMLNTFVFLTDDKKNIVYCSGHTLHTVTTYNLELTYMTQNYMNIFTHAKPCSP